MSARGFAAGVVSAGLIATALSFATPAPATAAKVTWPGVKVTELSLVCADAHPTVQVKRLHGDEGVYVRLYHLGSGVDVAAAFLPQTGTLTLQDPKPLQPGQGTTYVVKLDRLGKTDSVAQLIVDAYACKAAATASPP